MTLREIYEALLNGKKITSSAWRGTKYNYLNSDGKLVNDIGNPVYEPFLHEAQWSIYEEPEDLDNKIKHATRELGFHLASDMHLSIVKDLIDIIDLKIKQAKL